MIFYNYKSPIPKHLCWRNWAKDLEGIGDELADFINLQLFPTLKDKLKPQGPQAERVKVMVSVFEDASDYMKSDTRWRI
jgi:type I restriction enzyme M protein